MICPQLTMRFLHRFEAKTGRDLRPSHPTDPNILNFRPSLTPTRPQTPTTTPPRPPMGATAGPGRPQQGQHLPTRPRPLQGLQTRSSWFTFKIRYQRGTPVPGENRRQHGTCHQAQGCPLPSEVDTCLKTPDVVEVQKSEWAHLCPLVCCSVLHAFDQWLAHQQHTWGVSPTTTLATLLITALALSLLGVRLNTLSPLC